MSDPRSIRFGDELEAELVKVAASLDTTVNALVKAACRAAIDVAASRDVRLASVLAHGRLMPKPEPEPLSMCASRMPQPV